MSSRRLLPSRSTTTPRDPGTPTPPSSQGQHVISDISEQLTPRLSTRAHQAQATTSGRTPSSRRQPARTPAASTSRVTALAREGGLGRSTGKGKGRAAQLREGEGGGGGGGREGGRRSTPRARQPSSSTAPPPASIPRTTRSHSAQSASDAEDTEEISRSEEDSADDDDEEEDELEAIEEDPPNERQSAFQAAASSLHDFYLSSPAGRIDRPTEELLFNVLTCSFPLPRLAFLRSSPLPSSTSKLTSLLLPSSCSPQILPLPTYSPFHNHPSLHPPFSHHHHLPLPPLSRRTR